MAAMTFRASFLTAVAALALSALVIDAVVTLDAQTDGHVVADGHRAALMNPDDLKDQASAMFKANFDTTAGPFVVEVHRDWAPIGADRFYTLVKHGFYDGNHFYRVTPITVQFGISGDPDIAKTWLGAFLDDDPPSAKDA